MKERIKKMFKIYCFPSVEVFNFSYNRYKNVFLHHSDRIEQSDFQSKEIEFYSYPIL